MVSGPHFVVLRGVICSGATRDPAHSKRRCSSTAASSSGAAPSSQQGSWLCYFVCAAQKKNVLLQKKVHWPMPGEQSPSATPPPSLQLLLWSHLRNHSNFPRPQVSHHIGKSSQLPALGFLVAKAAQRSSRAELPSEFAVDCPGRPGCSPAPGLPFPRHAAAGLHDCRALSPRGAWTTYSSSSLICGGLGLFGT